MPGYPTVVPSDVANQDRVNQFRTYASSLPDPAQAQIDADLAAYNQHVSQLGDVSVLPASPSDSPSAAVSTSAAANSSYGPIDSSSREAFIRTSTPYAQAWEAKTGIPASYFIAIGASESNWGKAGGNELFGIKGSGNAGSLNTPTWESVNGKRVDINDNFAAYNSVNDAYQGFWNLLQNQRYAPALAVLRNGGSGYDFTRALNDAGYATDPIWAEKIRSIAQNQIEPVIGKTQPQGAQAPYPQGLGVSNVGQRDQPGPGTAATASGAVSGFAQSQPPTDQGGATLDSSLVAASGQPPSPNDDLKAFSAYASSLGDPGGTSSFGSNPQDATSPIDQARAQTPPSQTSGPDFGAMARSALDSVGSMASSMLPKPADQGFSLTPSATRAPSMQPGGSVPLGAPRSFSMPTPYNDMAGAGGPASLQEVPAAPQSSLVDQTLGIVTKAATLPQQAVSAAVMPDLGHINETPQQRTQRYWNEHTDPKADTITRLGQLLDYATSVEDTQVAAAVKQNPNAAFIAPAFKLATNPLSYTGASKAMMVGGGVGAAGFAGNAALQGQAPGEVAKSAVEGFNTGQLVGGLGEGAYNLGKVLEPAARKAVGATGKGLTALGEAGQEAGLVPGLSLQDVSGNAGSTRFFHGTGSSFGVPDAAKFDPNGLFGPGYYLTSDARVAGGVVDQSGQLKGLGYAQQRGTGAVTMLGNTGLTKEGGLSNLYQYLTNKQDSLRLLQSGSPSEIAQQFGPMGKSGITSSTKAIQKDIANLQGQIDELTRQGVRPLAPQTRAVNVPNNLKLLDAEKPVPTSEVSKIASVVRNNYGPDAAKQFQVTINQMTSMGAEPTGELIWNKLRNSFESGQTEGQKAASSVLQSAGYDGIQYAGGKRIPMNDATGKAIEHTAIVIFPESMGKLTNAISGTRFGTPPAVGGAIIGGLAGATQGNTPEERARNALLGAAAGGVGAYGLQKFGESGNLARLASEDSGAVGKVSRVPLNDPADRLVQMYTETPKAVPQSPGEIASKAGQAFVNAWTDRGVAWNRWQQQVEKTIGRPLNASEMSAELNRLNPDMAARVMVQEGLQPAIQSVPKEDLPTLSAYLTAQHNVDVAKSMGQKVQTEALKVPLATTEGEKRVRTLNAQTRSYERLKSDAAAAGDGTGVTHYDQLLTKSKADLATANRLAMKQVTALDAARAAGAQTAGKTAEDTRAFSGGLNANESQQALIQLQMKSTPGQWQAIQAASNKIDAYVNTLRQRMVDSGLWTPELAQELKTQYPHYNPTKILDYMQTPDSIPGGASISVRDQGLKKFTTEGTERLREDPLASLQRLAFQTESLAKRNEALNAFVKTNELIHGPNNPLRVIRKVADDYTPINTESKIAGFVDGKKQTYVMPKEFADAIQQAPMSPIKGLPVLTAIYRALLTSKNPAFVAGQIPLDAMSYAIRESTRAGGPQHLPQIMKELVSAYGDAFKGIRTQTYHGQTAEFLKGGGGFAGYHQINPGEARQSIEALHRSSPLEIRSGSDIKRIVKDVLTFNPVEAFGARAELAPRVASRNLALKAGANQVKAVINGRTVTMDFDQGGTWSKYLNQFVPFFNVGLQGLATPARTIRDNPRGALAAFAGLLMAPTIGAEVWNNADPQRAKDYADIPNYVKDRSIVLMLPGAVATDDQGERHPQYVEIRSREFSPFVDATRAVMQKVLGTDTRNWQDMAGGALNAASPVSTDSTLGLFGSVVPPGLSTGLDLANNRSSYTGSTIATKFSDARASGLSKGLASGINTASDATGLGLNVRPSQAEYAGRDLLGGPGQMARDVSNIATGQGSSGLPQDLPLAGQIIRRGVGGSIGQRLQTAQDQRVSASSMPILRQAGIYDLTPVTDHIGKIPLSNDEQAIYQETTNQYIDQILPAVAASPAYQSKSPADRAIILQNVMSKARELARNYTLTQVDRTDILNRIQREQAQKAS